MAVAICRDLAQEGHPQVHNRPGDVTLTIYKRREGENDTGLLPFPMN